MSSFYYAIEMINKHPQTKETNSADCSGEVAVAVCAHCNMFGHSTDDCAMLTGEYVDEYGEEYASENRSSQNVGSPHIFSSKANENVDYYAEYDKYLRICGDEHVSSLCGPLEEWGQEWGQEEDGEEGNKLTEEEYAQWMREAEEEDEYAEDHSPEADVRWVKQSSMAAFSHFQETGAKLKNSEFVGKKAGAPLRSEVMDE
jgi:hypothetical protein